MLTLVLGLAWRGRARRTDPPRAGLLMWGVWLLTFAVIFSEVSNLPHTAYLASLAPPIAALSGAGIVLFWRWYQAGGSRWWAAPQAVAAELGDSGADLNPGEQRLYTYLMAHRDGASYLMAVESWAQAGPYIVATGQEVLAIGGFSGLVPEPTLGHVRQLVSSGQLRFFLLGMTSESPMAIPTDPDSAPQKVARWVRTACAVVPAKAYGGTTSTAASGPTLYECPARA